VDEVISPTGGSARIQTRVEVGVDGMVLGVSVVGNLRGSEPDYLAR
jgi:hypothetical protein